MGPRLRKYTTGILAKALDALESEGSLTAERIRELTGCASNSACRVLGVIHRDYVVDLVHEEAGGRWHWRKRVVLSQRPLAARAPPAEKTIGGLRCWTEEDDRIARELYEKRVPLEEIAKELGRSIGSVRSRACVLGWLRRPPKQNSRRGPVAPAPYRPLSLRDLRPPAVPPYRRGEEAPLEAPLWLVG